MTTALEISDATLSDDGNVLRLELQLQNPGDRTVHAYRTLRAIRYDPATQTLEVQLSERGLEEHSNLGNFIWPRFVSIDPGGSTTIGLNLPRVLSRVQPSPTTVRTPVIEVLPAHEARAVEVEVAFSGTPFYDDPRPSAGGPRSRLEKWAEGYAEVRLVRDPSTDGPDDGTNGGPYDDGGSGPVEGQPTEPSAPRRAPRRRRRRGSEP